MMDKNWLTLNPNAFLWIKNNKGLVYNTNNNKKIEFPLSKNILKLCQKLLVVENLYSVELLDSEINDADVIQWINSLESIEAGYLSLNIKFEKRPVSLMPILKIQDDKMYYEEQQKLGFKGKILQNLHEITFYINGNNQGDDTFYKQTIYPIKGYDNLKYADILSFIKNSRTLYLSNINLVGEIFSYKDFELLVKDISDFSIQVTIYFLVNDFIDNLQSIRNIKWPSSVKFNIIVNNKFDVYSLQENTFPCKYTFLIFSENDITQYTEDLKLIDNNQDVSFIPLFNKTNISFFRKCVFLNKEDIENISLSKNEIFIHQKMNISDFGKLTILPNGNVYANVNDEPLGNIGDSPYSIVYKEITKGKSWFRLRTDEPCSECIYQWLCPTPSNYEIILNRPNLCLIK